MTNEELKKKIQEDDDRIFMESVSDIWYKLDLLRSRGFNAKDGLTVLMLMELQNLNFILDQEGVVGQALEALAGCVSDHDQFCTVTDVTGNIDVSSY